MISAIDRGLAPSDVKLMDVGQILDYCILYNEMHGLNGSDETEKKEKKRKATQADWDALLG